MSTVTLIHSRLSFVHGDIRGRGDILSPCDCDSDSASVSGGNSLLYRNLMVLFSTGYFRYQTREYLLT